VRETDALLQTILYQLEKSENIIQARRAVRVMCNKENLDAVAAQLAEEAEEDRKQKEG
jgi:hypothetical protein